MKGSLRDREINLFAQTGNFFSDTWEKTDNFFNSYQWQEVLFNIKAGFIILSFLLLTLIILILLKISIIKPLHKSLKKPSVKSDESFLSKRKIMKQWERIEGRIESGIEANYKLAVIEAGKLFDMILKNIGYGIEKKLTNIDEIKAANKLNDKILEDKKIKISKEQAEKSVEAYRQGLRELEML